MALALPPNQRYKARLAKANVFSLIVTLAGLSCLIKGLEHVTALLPLAVVTTASRIKPRPVSTNTRSKPDPRVAALLARAAKAEASPARYRNLGEQEPPDGGSAPTRVPHGNDCDHGADMRHELPQDERNASAAPVIEPAIAPGGKRATPSGYCREADCERSDRRGVRSFCRGAGHRVSAARIFLICASPMQRA